MTASFEARDRDQHGFLAAYFRSGRGPRSALLRNASVLAIVGLLATIAVLQYRWIRQIHDDMEDRARTSMETAMTQWSREFYRGLYSLCGGLIADPDAASKEGWADYLHRYSTWRHEEYHYDPANAARPGTSMVSKVYIWETAAGAAPGLFLLDSANSGIELVAVPSQLEPLLNRLRENSQSYEAAMRAWESRHTSSTGSATDRLSAQTAQLDPHYTGWQFDQGIPALVHPLVHHDRRIASVNAPRPPEQEPVDWMVVVLDLSTIQKNTFPVLVHRDFGSRHGLDYKVAVIAPGKPTQVIYSSDPGFPAQSDEAYDASMNVFGPLSRVVDIRVESALNSGESFGRDDTSRLSGPGWQWFPVIQYGSGTAPWKLVVQRRSGPIDATVNRVWRTNLLTGMAVLLLLTASVGLIVVAARRAQQLAQIEMNFVTGVSHELRTPLSVVLSAAENIADGVVDKPSDIREHGRIIIGQGRLLSDLVDRILSFSAGSAGIASEPPQPVDVSEVVDRVSQNLAEPIRSAGIYLELNIQPSLPCVLADPVVLSQCLQNLVVNAIKYRGHSKWISISADLSTNQSHSEIHIGVQDRGIGIRESELNSIFEPFYRSPEVVARQIQGTGLGLSVVRRSVLEMGGRLRVASMFGSGSTFTICLPVAPSKADDTAPSASKVNGAPVA
jgi:signal transduction histidine kinase